MHKGLRHRVRARSPTARTKDVQRPVEATPELHEFIKKTSKVCAIKQVDQSKVDVMAGNELQHSRDLFMNQVNHLFWLGCLDKNWLNTAKYAFPTHAKMAEFTKT